MSGLGTHTKGEAQDKTGQQQEPLQHDVSVIIAAWNAEQFIHHVMASVLDQAGLSLELIVIDDCSTDDTEAAARKAASDDKRVIISRMPENGGPSAARNYGLSMAKGRYAAVLDSDDSFVKDRLANSFQQLMKPKRTSLWTISSASMPVATRSTMNPF